MSISAPPRPPSPARTAPDSKPLEREEIEALVKALIEEARRETRRRHRRYWAVAALVVSVGVALLVLLEGGAASQSASPALPMRPNAAVQAFIPRLAFTSVPRWIKGPPPALGPLELYVVNADGSDKRVLARLQVTGGGGAVWSPDGQTIAFDSYKRVCCGNVELRVRRAQFLVNADGSRLRNVTRTWRNVPPNWSPDGRTIALVKSRGLYVMNADGSRLRRLTHNAPDVAD